MKKGFVAPPIKNNDGSFSIYRIESVFLKQDIPLEKVYNRISSFLHKQYQEEAKKQAINSFYKDLNIVTNNSIF